MPASPSIRPASPADAPSIADLQIRGWRWAYRGIFPDALLDGLDLSERTQQRHAHLTTPYHESVRNWVRTDPTGLVIGWACTGPVRDATLPDATHELLAIYLLPDRIGEGHGRALCTHLLDDLRARGYEDCLLWVLAENELALRFYRAAGFKIDDRVAPVEHRSTGALKVRMRRTLG